MMMCLLLAQLGRMQRRERVVCELGRWSRCLGMWQRRAATTAASLLATNNCMSKAAKMNGWRSCVRSKAIILPVMNGVVVKVHVREGGGGTRARSALWDVKNLANLCSCSVHHVHGDQDGARVCCGASMACGLLSAGLDREMTPVLTKSQEPLLDEGRGDGVDWRQWWPWPWAFVRNPT